MFIKVSEKFAPFYLEAGREFNLLGTFWKVTIWPQRLLFQNNQFYGSNEQVELLFNNLGEIYNFTVLQNLENEEIEVFGHSENGYIRYTIKSQKEGASIFLDRGKSIVYTLPLTKERGELFAKKELLIKLPLQHYKAITRTKDRLFLGVHKKQDFNRILIRKELTEILPIWYFLAQSFPNKELRASNEMNKLLKNCEERILEDEELKRAFLRLLKAGFSGILVPHLFDNKWQGIINAEEKILSEDSPIPILVKGAEYIRKIFFKQEGASFYLLNNLPAIFFCGRFVNINCSPFGSLSMEWSKKLLKKMEFKASKSFEMELHLQSKIENFRLRLHMGEKGKIYKSGEKIPLEEGKHYLFDRFQK